jgi:hypothetical protein
MGSKQTKPTYLTLTWKDELGKVGKGVFEDETDWVLSDDFPGGQNMRIKLVRLEQGTLPKGKVWENYGRDYYVFANQYRDLDWIIYAMDGYKNTCPKMLEVTHWGQYTGPDPTAPAPLEDMEGPDVQAQELPA